MQKKITKTQIIALIVLSLVLISALFMQYALLPAMDRYAVALKDNDNAKIRQRKMDGLINTIEQVNLKARDAKAVSEAYKSEFLIFDALEDIEWDFTRTLLAKQLNPLAISIATETTTDENPFEKFSVYIYAEGKMDAVISMIGYINIEKSYRLTDLKITGSQEYCAMTVTVSVAYVKDEA